MHIERAPAGSIGPSSRILRGCHRLWTIDVIEYNVNNIAAINKKYNGMSHNEK